MSSPFMVWTPAPHAPSTITTTHARIAGNCHTAAVPAATNTVGRPEPRLSFQLRRAPVCARATSYCRVCCCPVRKRPADDTHECYLVTVLSDDARYEAILARDPRFDGVFFVGVSTTGVYCRPICPARTPGRTRCAFFATPVQAEAAGFRACFRCRPCLF